MTAAVDDTSVTFNRLIETCEEAEAGFRLAAESADDEAARRLFRLYSQQRTRFAEELRQHLRSPLRSQADGTALEPLAAEKHELLNRCMEREKRAMALYEEALRERIPAKAHFLLAAQYALMQKAHERMQSVLFPAPVRNARSALTAHRY